MSQHDEENYWHISKNINIASIVGFFLTISLQSATALILATNWTAKMNERVAQLEEQSQEFNGLQTQIIENTVLNRTQTTQLERIEDKLDRVIREGSNN